MKIRKGRLRLSPNEEAQIVKEETEKRRKLRIQQVREQSKENAAKIRDAVKKEKHKQLMRLATDIKDQLDAEKAERVRHLEQQYDNSLRNIGVGHKMASELPDWSEERELVQRTENLRAEARGRTAMDKLREDTAIQTHEAQKHIIARNQALAAEKKRAAEIASMPPPPPDPLRNVTAPKQHPVKVTDMNTFSTSHYHLQNEHAVDKAGPDEQVNARDAAEIEQDRIQERALELKRLRQDQLERARLRHNAALEKELLKHDYNNILHDLSDLQRADRDRRLRIVHNIPKQVFEPPNTRMEDREDKQRYLEEEFENMYMAGTDHLGDISMALDPMPRPMTPSQENSLDVTGADMTGTPIQEPTLPGMPSVLRDMTNMPKSPAKKPEKVLRNLMDRIKSQREEWVNTQSMLEVGEGTLPGQPPVHQHLTQGVDTHMTNGVGYFQPLVPDESPDIPQQHLYAPSAEKVAIVQSPVAITATAGAPPDVARERSTAMNPAEFSHKLRSANERQQTNIQLPSQPAHVTSVPPELQQAEFAEILKQQEHILAQKKQLELKLQQLTFEQQRIQLTGKVSQGQQQHGQGQVQPQQYHQGQAGALQQGQPSAPHGYSMPPASSMYHTGPTTMQQSNVSMEPNSLPSQFQGQILSSLPQGQGQLPIQTGAPIQQLPVATISQQPQQNLASSLSSSGMSQNPMNSIPPTHTTGTMPMMTSQGQGFHGYQSQPTRSAYQPPSAVLTTDQLTTHAQTSQLPFSQPNAGVQISAQNGYPQVTMATSSGSLAPVSSAGHVTISPGHVPPASLTSVGMNDQMRKVKEYQEYLLARHEQSKKVLEETKAEIKRRREHLLDRYPNLDLSRLEDLGAKYLESQPGATRPPQQDEPVHQGQPVPAPRSQGQSQGQSQPSSVTSLLASLASHPYYAATLSQQEGASSLPHSIAPPTSLATVGAVQMNGLPPHPNINSEMNLRKNKLESIRKSLPFDGDDSFQTPVRVYEAYTQKSLDTTSATDVTESDTSTLTERGSPALKPAPRPAPRHLEPGHKQRTQQTTEQDLRKPEQSFPRGLHVDSSLDESEIDTTASGSFISDREDASTVRQDELKIQLAEIQRQKEDIIRRHQQGQQKLANKEEELKAKLATLAPDDLAQQLRDSVKQIQQVQDPIQRDTLQDDHRPFNLSTIHEVDTPSTARPDTARSGSLPSDGENTSQHSQLSKRSLEYLQPSRRGEAILEQPDLENVETQMEQVRRSKSPGVNVADYSGKNIDDVLERAKRFESEVLEKLRKQTNAVLFDNEFDDSLEFNVSKQQVSAEPLSTGSLTDDSLSTGPLDDTTLSRQDPSKSANGSFQSSQSWANHLSQFKMPASNQAELPFKVVPSTDMPDARLQTDGNSRDLSTDNRAQNGDSVFTSDRFKVYSAINDSSASTSASESGMLDNSESRATDSMNAGDMLQHLQDLQQQLRKGEEERMLLARKLAEQQNQSSEPRPADRVRFSKSPDHPVSRPFSDQDRSDDLSQYSLTDTSADVSAAGPTDQSERRKMMSYDSPDQPGTRSQERELPPVRRSPIGHSAKGAEFQRMSTNGKGPQDLTVSDYSFSMSDSKQQRSTSTPGDERRKSALDGTQRSELPSEITVGDKTSNTSSKTDKYSFKSAGDLSEYSMMTAESSSNRKSFETLSPERKADSPMEDLSQLSMTSVEEDIEGIKTEFKKLENPTFKVKTYAVNMDGDLISENSDSDKSQGVKNGESVMTDLTNYSFSTTRDSTDKFKSKKDTNSGLSLYSLPENSSGNRLSQASEFSNRSSEGRSTSMDSNPKSSSFTNVTSDPSMNMTGISNLSQYTLNDTHNDPTQGSASLNNNDNNYVQERFASLDNLISESKHLIARHKQVIEKNKNLEPEPPALPKQPPPSLLESKPREVKTTVPYATDFQKFKSTLSSSKPADDSSRLSSIDTSNKTDSLSQPRDSSATQDTTGNQSSTMDENSLEYLVENSAGITDEEPLPDLTTMTLGSELSISEAFNKTEDLSESSDSLKSFEKHEISDGETTHYFADDSLRESSKSDNLQRIVEARRHNFMVQSEQRASAAKERALSQRPGKTNEHPVFRAVPVNIVAKPMLSMAVSTSKPDRGRSAIASATVPVKGAKSVSDAKKSFEAKEQEIKATIPSKSLNRALQPRGAESPSPKDGGTLPSEAVSKQRDTSPSSGRFGLSRFSGSPLSSPDDRNHHGRLFGEIQQFGGSSGLAQKQSPSPPTLRKTPPKVMPKPVRSKPELTQPAKPTTGLSKTLSSWKKSRAVSAPQAGGREPEAAREAPKNSIKVLPDAPPPMSEEERRKRAEDELYEKNIRAYNPRLFRLQHKLDTTDELDTTGSSVSPPEKNRDSKKKRRKFRKKTESAGNLRINRK